MDAKNLIDTAAPTPYGWVITTQSEFDLNNMLAFRNQLLSLSRAFGASASIGATENVAALVPVRSK